MKKLSQEDDLTIIKEYAKVGSGSGLDLMDIITFTFLIVLYYSGYARWFFWFLIVTLTLYLLIIAFDGVNTRHKILQEEMKRRGFGKGGKDSRRFRIPEELRRV